MDHQKVSTARTSLVRSTGSLFILFIVLGLFSPSMSRGFDITHTSSVSVTAVVGSSGSEELGGGGGGGGSSSSSRFTRVFISGFGYPGLPVYISYRGGNVLEAIAGIDGFYSVSVEQIPYGLQTLSIWALDSRGVRSATRSLLVDVPRTVDLIVSEFNVPPTVAVSSIEIKRGEQLKVSGFARPGSLLEPVVAGESLNQEVRVGADGSFEFFLGTAAYAFGGLSIRVRSLSDQLLSKFASIRIGLKSIELTQDNSTKKLQGDVNGDSKVNLTDFSIIAFWYGRSGVPPDVDLTGDGKITLRDFSILAYAWQE